MNYLVILLLLLIPITAFGQLANQAARMDSDAGPDKVKQGFSTRSAGRRKFVTQDFSPNYGFNVEVRVGVLSDGSANNEWLKAIKDRNSSIELEKIKATKKTLSPEEQKWLKLVNNALNDWSSGRQNLHIPFRNIKIPEKLIILVGNQGGDDGFTYLDNTICLDLASWVQNYGDADILENRERLIRVMDHEYTHLLHGAWFKNHSLDLRTPLDRALRDCLVEGFGNYRSLSNKWINESGKLTEYAKSTLKELQPIFVERLTKLQLADTTEEEQLREGLSRGPFNKKWGALCVALWLAQETNGNDINLAKWIESGPRGIIDLARKYLPGELKTKFLK